MYEGIVLPTLLYGSEVWQTSTYYRRRKSDGNYLHEVSDGNYVYELSDRNYMHEIYMWRMYYV
jgi:hypothetical protein